MARVERDQIIEAAAIERQILHFLLIDHAGNGRRGGVDNGSLRGNRYLLQEAADFETHVHYRILADFEIRMPVRTTGFESSLDARTLLADPADGQSAACTVHRPRIRDDGPVLGRRFFFFDAGHSDGRTVDGAAGRILNTGRIPKRPPEPWQVREPPRTGMPDKFRL